MDGIILLPTSGLSAEGPDQILTPVLVVFKRLRKISEALQASRTTVALSLAFLLSSISPAVIKGSCAFWCGDEEERLSGGVVVMLVPYSLASSLYCCLQS